jgi:hypothetical protein
MRSGQVDKTQNTGKMKSQEYYRHKPSEYIIQRRENKFMRIDRRRENNKGIESIALDGGARLGPKGKRELITMEQWTYRLTPQAQTIRNPGIRVNCPGGTSRGRTE